MANWLETYVDLLELTLWSASTARTASYNEKSGKWIVPVSRPGKSDRIFQVDHVVFATGWINGGKPWVPEVKGRENFKGEVMHSLDFKSARDHQGKKVLVVGACTSGLCFLSIVSFV
jgi:cation diffusion facilitator CzcD-associated flavoprotein CzcO